MRTFLSISGGRLEVRMRVLFRCLDCDRRYHPAVYAHPRLVIGLNTVMLIALIAIAVLWWTGRIDRWWLLAAKVAVAIVVVWTGWLASRLHAALLEPRLHARGSGREPEFGEIVLDCPRCGSGRAELDGARVPRASR